MNLIFYAVRKTHYKHKAFYRLPFSNIITTVILLLCRCQVNLILLYQLYKQSILSGLIHWKFAIKLLSKASDRKREPTMAYIYFHKRSFPKHPHYLSTRTKSSSVFLGRRLICPFLESLSLSPSWSSPPVVTLKVRTHKLLSSLFQDCRPRVEISQTTIHSEFTNACIKAICRQLVMSWKPINWWYKSHHMNFGP